MKNTTLTDAKGNQYVLLPKRDYEQMLQKLEDALDLKILRERAKGDRGRETIDASMMRRLLTENPIKVWREYRSLSQAQLAKKLRVSAMYISHLETGKKNGSTAILRKIAAVLDIDLDDLV